MAFHFRELRKKLCPALALGCLLGSVALAQKVQTSYLPGTTFSVYHKYQGAKTRCEGLSEGFSQYLSFEEGRHERLQHRSRLSGTAIAGRAS